jgi:phytoene dehydrogenase-like protein
VRCSTQYQAVVVGAGHNGLTCACYLARARLKVLVLEQYRADGGMSISEELLSERYLPGLRERILARTVHSPEDLERQIISVVHGTHQHGTFLPYQVGVMRPIPELGGYRTPLANV